MLGIDRPRAKRQQVEPATDPAVSPLQRRDSIPRQRAGRDLRLGGAHAPPARLQPPEPRRQRAAAAVSGQDDRTEPGANHAADPAIPAGRRTPTRPLPAASLCPQVHARRRRTASGGGRGPRNPQRPGHAQDPRAGIPAVPAARIRAAGGDLGGPDLSPAAASASAAFDPAPAVSIGERRRPDPQGQPGFLRVDTVIKGIASQGVYHINACHPVEPGWSRC